MRKLPGVQNSTENEGARV